MLAFSILLKSKIQKNAVIDPYLSVMPICGISERNQFFSSISNFFFSPRLFCTLLEMKLALVAARLYLIKAGELSPGVPETRVFLCAQSLPGISTVQLYMQHARH